MSIPTLAWRCSLAAIGFSVGSIWVKASQTADVALGLWGGVILFSLGVMNVVRRAE